MRGATYTLRARFLLDSVEKKQHGFGSFSLGLFFCGTFTDCCFSGNCNLLKRFIDINCLM
jgi:hypothetical protein